MIVKSITTPHSVRAIQSEMSKRFIMKKKERDLEKQKKKK